MQHLLVWNKALAANSVEAALTFVSDPFTSSDASGNPLLPMKMRLLYAAGLGLNLSTLRFNSPHFRSTFLPYIWPLMGNDTVGSDPNIADYRDYPLGLPALEGIEVDASTGSGTDTITLGAFVSDTGIQPASGGEPYSLKNTAAITAVPYAWTGGAMTFGQSLPQGTYALVGAQVISATGIFARFIFPGQAARPGVVCSSAVSVRPPFAGTKQPTGIMGVFPNTVLPQVEIYCRQADTSQTIYMDLVKIG